MVTLVRVGMLVVPDCPKVFVTRKVPPLTVVWPENPPALVMLTASSPVPFFVRPAVCLKEVIVALALFTVIVGVVPPKVRLPPERVMLPEAEPKVRELAVTLPETVIVPAARPLVDVPKFSASEVVVFVVPDNVTFPATAVLQPWVELFVVGGAQVPPAVPKPTVELFVSQ